MGNSFILALERGHGDSYELLFDVIWLSNQGLSVSTHRNTRYREDIDVEQNPDETVLMHNLVWVFIVLIKQIDCLCY